MGEKCLHMFDSLQLLLSNRVRAEQTGTINRMLHQAYELCEQEPLHYEIKLLKDDFSVQMDRNRT